MANRRVTNQTDVPLTELCGEQHRLPGEGRKLPQHVDYVMKLSTVSVLL
jgi:hypothetical protein